MPNNPAPSSPGAAGNTGSSVAGISVLLSIPPDWEPSAACVSAAALGRSGCDTAGGATISPTRESEVECLRFRPLSDGVVGPSFGGMVGFMVAVVGDGIYSLGVYVRPS